jgi:hypothetical protein
MEHDLKLQNEHLDSVSYHKFDFIKASTHSLLHHQAVTLLLVTRR